MDRLRSFNDGPPTSFSGPGFRDSPQHLFAGAGNAGSPRVEPAPPKIETIPIEDLICKPGRTARPEHIVVIMRGPAGAGKSYISKLLKDKEVSNGGSSPRTLSLDDYFMMEVEKVIADPESGKKVKQTVLEYEYEKEMEEEYRKNMLKSFKKHIDNCHYNFIIVDAINNKVSHFEDFWTYAKSKGFQVYVAEVMAELSVCEKRNIHKRTEEEIKEMLDTWEELPPHYIRLDIRTLLQSAAIEEVEMEDTPAEPENPEPKKEEAEEEEEEEAEGVYKKSRWELDASEDKLDRLDGLQKKKREASPQRLEDYLQTSDYISRSSTDGKKHVRWADIEERADQLRRREVGFIVGQTDWDKLTDDTYAHRALNQTKYI